MSDRPFVHLHCHSHYSLLDGASSIPKLVQRTADHGMNALALTDHGNMHGALEFYRACKSKDINPSSGVKDTVAKHLAAVVSGILTPSHIAQVQPHSSESHR